MPFTSVAPSLYTYPASAALASASHAMEQLLVHSSTASPSRAPGGTAHYPQGLVKDSVGAMVHGLPPQYQQSFATHPYVTTGGGAGRAEATYGGYQLSPRRLTQYPYL